MVVSVRFAVVAAALLGLTVLAAAPREAAARGSGYRYAPPPVVIVVPHAREGRAHSYGPYGRSAQRRGPPAYAVVPMQRYYAPPRYRGRQSDFSFSFRF